MNPHNRLPVADDAGVIHRGVGKTHPGEEHEWRYPARGKVASDNAWPYLEVAIGAH